MIKPGQSTSKAPREWAIAIAATSLLLMLQPIVAIVQTGWPPRLIEASWRYGMVGSLAESVHLLVLGVFGAFAASRLTGSPKARSLAQALAAVVLLALLVAMVVFLTAAFSWAADISAAGRPSFWRQTTVSTVSLTLSASVLAAFIVWDRRR